MIAAFALLLSCSNIARADVWELQRAQQQRAEEERVQGEIQKSVARIEASNATIERALGRFLAAHQGMAGQPSYRYGERMTKDDLIFGSDHAVLLNIPRETEIYEIKFTTGDGFECSMRSRSFGGDTFCIHTVTGQHLRQEVKATGASEACGGAARRATDSVKAGRRRPRCNAAVE